MIGWAQQHDWVIGYLDEVWWSRFALPAVRLWSAAYAPVRLAEKTAGAQDTEPKALACYGLWCDDRKAMLLRFVDGRPVSHVTTAFLEWIGEQLWQQGRKVLVLIWDNASWHVSAEVRTWIGAHNARAKRQGQGVRILVAGLPTKSPWLNKIEPKWKYGKEAILEAQGTLTAREVEERVCAYFATEPQAHLVQRKEPPTPPVKREVATEKAARLQLKSAHAVKTQQAA